MRLIEAIKVQEKRLASPFLRANADTLEATRIGLEAMKKLQWFREKKYYYARTLLPGETEE